MWHLNKKIKIMHGITEVAGQNSYSVKGLRKIGEDAESIVFFKHPFDYPYDKCLNMDKTRKILYPYYAIKAFLFFCRALGRYNVFHFHFGRSILNCYELPFYHIFNKKIFFEYHGSDLRDYKKFCYKTGLRYDSKLATRKKFHKRNKMICNIADGIIVHDDELIDYLPDTLRAPLYVVPLRVDIDQFIPQYPIENKMNVRIVHAPSKREGKGTKYVLKAVEHLKRKYPFVELILVEGKSQKDAISIYKTADIIIDQLFVGTYGVFAIESMALGKPVVTYISDEMKLCLPEDLPIVSANRENLEEKLEELINDGELRRSLGMAGRNYVKTYHDYRTNATILRDIYRGKLKQIRGRQAFELAKTRSIKDSINV